MGRTSAETAMPGPMGRPMRYSRELAEAICRRLAEGESLRTICGDAGKPNFSTVMQWVIEDRGGFQAKHWRATGPIAAVVDRRGSAAVDRRAA